jgi:hypothetical protein
MEDEEMPDGKKILDEMDARFFDKNKPWTYLYEGRGGTTYAQKLKNGTVVTGPGIDCSNLVHQTMLTAGYNVQAASSGKMNEIINGTRSNDYSKVDDYKNIRAGDVVVFKGHVGIVRQYNPVTGIGLYSGSQSEDSGVVKDVAFTTNPNVSAKSVEVDGQNKKFWLHFGTKVRPLSGVLRVNENANDPAEAKKKLDAINRNVDAGLSGAKQSPYFNKNEPTSMIEGDSGQREISTYIDDNGNGITVTRPFAA